MALVHLLVINKGSDLNEVFDRHISLYINIDAKYDYAGTALENKPVSTRRQMMQRASVLCIMLVMCFYFTAASFAYETIPFKNGGSIEGVVEFAGAKVPNDPIVTLTSETDYCGKSLPAQKYLIRNRKIQNVVVFLENIKAGKAIPRESLTVTSLKCEFIPHVAVGFKGNKIILKTDDPVFHVFDVHASISGREVYHVALPEQGSTVTKDLSKSGLLNLTCYPHPWQYAYVYIFDHPYVAVTDEKGEFIIKDILPRTYTVKAWHEVLGTTEILDIKVESGKTSTIKVKYTKEQ
jgi:hypothetical protein